MAAALIGLGVIVVVLMACLVGVLVAWDADRNQLADARAEVRRLGLNVRAARAERDVIAVELDGARCEMATLTGRLAAAQAETRQVRDRARRALRYRALDADCGSDFYANEVTGPTPAEVEQLVADIEAEYYRLHGGDR